MRHWFAIVLMTVSVVACDSLVRSTFRLTPPAAAVQPVDATRARYQIDHRAALSALDGLAQQFDFRVSIDEPRTTCLRTWRRDAPGWNDPTQLYLCVRAGVDGRLEVELAELITSQWTPRGEIVRRALVDTLARYGQLDTLLTR